MRQPPYIVERDEPFYTLLTSYKMYTRVNQTFIYFKLCAYTQHIRKLYINEMFTF